MNNRGQAALEYLMTYGWALIVIAIVVGVLVFIVSSPAGPQCSSTDPAKIVMKTQNLSRTESASKILLQNITGGDITIKAASADSTAFSKVMAGTSAAKINNVSMKSSGMTLGVTAGNSIEIKPDYVGSPTSLTNATYKLTYDDAFQLSKSVTITCNGSLPA